ncbi:hypothetical protein CRENBAI_000802 [Crenichthys baileyi]|uniref:Uncharacterized protein n=1 Tax=Crenichthys baileyi TaxID=28760 RepID=A0AAV9QQ97_9TELE
MGTKNSARSAERNQTRFDQRVLPAKLEVGDRVLVRNMLKDKLRQFQSQNPRHVNKSRNGKNLLMTLQKNKFHLILETYLIQDTQLVKLF